MKVCFDHQIFSGQERGGIAKYFAQLACLLPTQGCEVVLPFAFTTNRHYFEFGGKALIGVPHFRGNFRVCNLLNRYRRIGRSRFDVWHATYYDGSVIDRFGADRLVSTLHDMTPELMPGEFQVNPHLDKERYARLSKRLIAVSQWTRDDACRLYGIDPAKIDVIHHGIDLADRTTAEIDLPDRFILFVGSRLGYKNFDRLLLAFARLAARHPDLKLLCVGAQPFSAAEIARIAELKLGGVLAMRASDAQLRHVMSRAAALVYPSLYEGFGLPLLEAMAQGCCMAVADASCFPEIAQDAAAYFDPLDPAAMADTIDRMLNDLALRKRLIGRGTARVKDFSLTSMLANTAKTYRAAMD